MTTQTTLSHEHALQPQDGIPGPLDGWRLDSFKTPLRIHDLNERGCFVIALYDARPGAALDLKIALPHGRCVRVKGEVLYHNHEEFGFAVRFTDVPPYVREALASYVPQRDEFVAALAQ